MKFYWVESSLGFLEFSRDNTGSTQTWEFLFSIGFLGYLLVHVIVVLPTALILFRKWSHAYIFMNSFIKFRKRVLPKHITFNNHLAVFKAGIIVANRWIVRIIIIIIIILTTLYAYENAYTKSCSCPWLYNLYFPFTLFNIHRRYVLPSLGCLLLSFIRTWSPRGKWPLSPLDNSLLFKTEFVPIRDCRVYFPRLSY